MKSTTAEADQAGLDAHLDDVAAEIGADGALLDHGERRGQGAGAQQRRQRTVVLAP